MLLSFARLKLGRSDAFLKCSVIMFCLISEGEFTSKGFQVLDVEQQYEKGPILQVEVRNPSTPEAKRSDDPDKENNTHTGRFYFFISL